MDTSADFNSDDTGTVNGTDVLKPDKNTGNPGSNYAAMGMTAFGGITSALGSYYAGKTQQAIANANAEIGRIQSQEAIRTGEFAANRAITRGRQVEGQQRAAEGASGIVAGAGTGALAEASTEQASHMDQLMIQRNAAREALGFRENAAADTEQGVLARATGNAGAISTLLNTGAQEWLESDPQFRGYHGSGISFGGR